MLKGMVAMVTGGASGLGRAAVERFVKGGAKVIVCDISPEGPKVAEKLGPSVIFSHCDVSEEQDVKASVSLCKKNFKRLDVLVNCAGLATVRPVYHAKKNAVHGMDEFMKLHKVNLFGTFNAIRMATPLFARNDPSDEDGQRGVIINVASIAGLDGPIASVAYSSTKGAVIAMTLPIARDLATLGVRNVTIAPGFFKTPILDGIPARTLAYVEANLVFPKRIGILEEFAHLVETVILNRTINGETIRLDGAFRGI